MRAKTRLNPSPPLPPSPASGRGGKRGSPLPLCGRGAGGEGNKKRVSLVHSEPKRCTLISYTPLPQRGRGAGGEGENSASVPHAANPSAVPLSNLQEAVLACPCFNTNRAGGVYNCPPPLGSPRFARGTAKGAPTRFPLLAGGTLRRGLSGILVFVNFGCAIGINCPPPLGSPRFARGTKPIGSPCVQGEPYGGGYRAYSFL